MKSEEILQVVKGRYDKFAEVSGAATGCCCCPSAAPASPGFAAQHGLYTPADLASVPKIAVNLSRGCGNPVSFAGLQPGEVVVDFGSGGGLDVILAARQVNPGGKVIGVDFAPHMTERAKQAVAEAGLSGSAVSRKRWVSNIWHSVPKPKQRSGRDSAPFGKRSRAPLFVNFASDETTLLIKMIVNLGVNRAELLQRLLAPKPLHGALSSPKWLM